MRLPAWLRRWLRVESPSEVFAPRRGQQRHPACVVAPPLATTSMTSGTVDESDLDLAVAVRDERR